jgi:dTDP-4-dehydrorhamnose reductase
VKVLVTGAAGMLGRDVTAACHARGHEVVALAHPALDICDPGAVDAALASYHPDAVVNCAAFTDVDGAEDDEAGAMRINDEGAALLAAAAETVGAKIVQPSSDYVFDGSTGVPYVESDMPAPLSAYGRSKQAGETSVAVANPRHFVVRASWLFGLAGKNFVETMLRLGGEQPEVLVVSDQVGCPTYTRHLGEALAQLVEGEEYGIHHIAGGGQCSWYEFAQEIFDQAGVECRVMAATTEMLARKAPRPAYSVLGTARPHAIRLPHWRRGLAEYLAARQVAEAAA